MNGHCLTQIFNFLRKASGERTSERRIPHLSPTIEHLETKQLMSVVGGQPHQPLGQALRSHAPQSKTFNLQHDVGHFRTDLRAIQRKSHVTQAEYAAYNKDAVIVLNAPLYQRNPADPAVLSLDLDTGQLLESAFLDGWKSDQDWDVEKHDLANKLVSLGYSIDEIPIDQMVTDLRQVAQSAGVSQAQYMAIQTDMAKLQADEMPPVTASLIPPPDIIFTSSLHGFVHSRRPR